MTSLTARPYQAKLEADVFAAWATVRNVLAVLPTGGGKTFCFSEIIERSQVVTCVLAHRAELVAQASLALARNGLRHRVVAPQGLRADIDGQHVAEFGRRYCDPHSNVVVASVQTIVNRPEAWHQACGLWVCDEAHHLLTDNLWGRAVAMFPNARGLGVTATPLRADGKGLGRHADGLFDTLVEGPSMRALIGSGYLTDYKIYRPPSDIDLTGVAVTASGDFSPEPLRAAVHRSHIVGDIVAHYLRLAPGKQGITFTVDVEGAEETATAYRAAGVQAEVLSAKTPAAWRMRVMRAFRAGEVTQLVNCDLLGEGTDVPAVEVVSFGRPTASYGLYVQQFGRALRLAPGKSRAIIIDHAGNVIRHGLPDAKREWTLDRRERRARSGPAEGVIPLTSCGECGGVYERVHSACPYCGFAPEPAGRSGPAFVDGDLVELDEATLARMRGDVERIDGPALAAANGLSGMALAGFTNTHIRRQIAQRELRDIMAIWGGWRDAQGDELRMAQKRFYLTFGIDVMTAQTLGNSDAEELQERIKVNMGFEIIEFLNNDQELLNQSLAEPQADEWINPFSEWLSRNGTSPFSTSDVLKGALDIAVPTGDTSSSVRRAARVLKQLGYQAKTLGSGPDSVRRWIKQ